MNPDDDGGQRSARPTPIHYALVLSVLLNVALALTCLILQNQKSIWRNIAREQQSLMEQKKAAQ